MKKWFIGLIIFLVFFVVLSVSPIFIRNRVKYSPTDYDKKIDLLLVEMDKANTIRECKRISRQILKLGAECGQSFDKQICIEGSDWMDICIGGVAAKQNNQSLCFNKMRNIGICAKQGLFSIIGLSSCVDYVEEECFFEFMSRANKNTKINIDCSSFEESTQRDNCFGFLATAKLDPKICLNISSNNFKSKCLSYFAFRNNDDSLCNYGKDWQIRDCKETLNILRKNDISICEGINSFYHEIPGENNCYIGFAIFNRDPTLCPKNKNPFTSNTCERYTQ
jgi:hypothetical protein